MIKVLCCRTLIRYLCKLRSFQIINEVLDSFKFIYEPQVKEVEAELKVETKVETKDEVQVEVVVKEETQVKDEERLYQELNLYRESWLIQTSKIEKK